MPRWSLILLMFVISSCLYASDSNLAPAASLAMHGFMVRNPERLPGPEGHYRFYFSGMGLPFPTLVHAQWDLGDCTGRALESWLFVRRMTGDTEFGKTVENGQRALLLSLLDPTTGMISVPGMGDPVTGDKYYQMWDQGRTLRALVRWWIAEKDPRLKAQLKASIDRLIAGVDQSAVHGTDAKYGEYAVWHGDAFVGATTREDLRMLRGGQLMEPLAMYWQASKDPKALSLAKRVCAGVLSGHEADGYTGSQAATMQFNSDGSFTGHFHNHASTALGVAKFGAALYKSGEKKRGLELLRWAKRVYDWTLSPGNVNAGGSFGWFPENNDEMVSARHISEVCSIADMIEFAATLASASRLDASLKDYDALWDHVERYTVNTVLHSQFKITPAYIKMLKAQHTVSNGFISLDTDSQGTFNHAVLGHQTLQDKHGSHLSQMTYAIQYDGKTAGFKYWEGSFPMPQNCRVIEQTNRVGSALVSKVVTTDGALQIIGRTYTGHGPYAIREFILKNTSDHPVSAIRLTCAANLDSVNWSSDIGQAEPDAGRIIFTSADTREWAALAGSPRPDYVCVDDASAILSSCDDFGWQERPLKMQGNPAGTVGWQIGELAPGEEKTVKLIMALGGTKNDLDRAISGKEFPGWDGVFDLTPSYLKTAKQMEGGFAACAYPNDLVMMLGGSMPAISWMGCCQYAGMRGLYGAWEPTFDEKPESLSVRLPLDRKGNLATQTVIEKNGQVVRTLQLRSKCRVEMRIPDWVDIGKVRVKLGQTRQKALDINNRWLRFGQLAAGSRLVVMYPLTKRVTHERVGGDNKGDGFCAPESKIKYTVTWLGNSVSSISPAGRYMPLFGRPKEK